MKLPDATQKILEIRDRVLAGGKPTHAEGMELLGLGTSAASDLLAAAVHVRERRSGSRIHLCAIVNAKSGNCPEDCGFCAQSVHNRAEIVGFPMISVGDIVDAARKARKLGARCFSIVTSGRSVSARDLDTVCEAVRAIRGEIDIHPSASLGILTEAMGERLRDAGLGGYHHNVETAASYYPSVCSTHSYEENLETLRLAKRLGFTVCSGGVFGIGETLEHRVEMAETLSREEIDRVCLNFFIPIRGTRFEHERPLTPVEILKTIAVYRLFMPTKDVNICAGRELHLRDLQGMIFFAGASAMMIGDYLTQKGRPPEEDLHMLRDLGLEW
jgi:biotin synthase